MTPGAVSGLVASAGGSGWVTSFFIELGVVLLALAVLARLAQWVGVSPIPLYLLAGVLIGAVQPPDLSQTAVDVVSQVAIVLLLFMLGLEYTGEEVGDVLRGGWLGGAVDVVLNFTPGFAAALLLGWGWTTALLLGGVTYISSSSITAKVLDDLDRLGNRETPAVLSLLVIEDLVMAPYLPLVAVLLAGGGALAALGSVGAALVVTAVALRIALRHGHKVSAGIWHPNDEIVLLTVVGLLLVAGGLAELLQVSAGVIAFLVGLAISGALAERSRRLLTPLRDLFAAFFFVLFGQQIDLGAFGPVLLVAVILWVVTSVTKLATGWLAAQRMGSAVPGRVRAGTALIARGEFSIVIAGLAVAGGGESRLGALAAAYVLFTAVTGPVLTRFADPLTRRFWKKGGASPAGAQGAGGQHGSSELADERRRPAGQGEGSG